VRLAALVLLLAAGGARANDSTALLEAGGIVLTTSKDVVMQSEELHIARDKVKVAYVFRNTGREDVRTRVAFPVPEWDDEDEADLLLDRRSDNPMGFALTVDGEPRKFETEVRRTDGKVKVTHHWEQVFPTDRSVAVTHAYAPAAGSFFFAGDDVDADLEAELVGRYCVGPKLLAEIRAKPRFLWAVHYVLKTGANWKGPIGRFTLTIDKGNPKDKVSVCIAATRRATPTTFEVKRTDWTPTDDLRILFVPAPT
jgi:hypothetical protein